MNTQAAWKILAPVDLNGNAGRAVNHAIAFSEATGGELVLLHVVEAGLYKEARGADWPRQATSDAPAHLSIRRVVLPGEPAATICRYADFIDANLVLMRPREGSDGLRFWRESVTAGVLAATDRPVQLARTAGVDPDSRFRCRKILCVLNLDGSDDPVIECAGRLAARSGAEIAILHVLPETSEALLYCGVPPCDRPLSMAVTVDRIRALEDRLRAACPPLILAGGLHRSVVIAARQVSADLVIFGRARPGAWAPTCPRPRPVLRRIACPVLTVPVSLGR